MSQGRRSSFSMFTLVRRMDESLRSGCRLGKGAMCALRPASVEKGVSTRWRQGIRKGKTAENTGDKIRTAGAR